MTAESSNSAHFHRDALIVYSGTQSVFLTGPWYADEEVPLSGNPDEPCRACRGTGTRFRHPDEPCDRCHGEGIEL